MKTNVIMIRKMGTFDVFQRTKDGYFDANALLSKWNSVRNNPERKMSRFLDSPKTKEFIFEIESDSPSAEMTNGSTHPFDVKKGRNTSKGKTKDEVWMHPYLFIDFAMWINPKFKLSVIKFVYDELIKNRHDAGDNYKILSASIVKLKNHNFQEVATAIQWIVFNKTGKDLRQKANPEELKEIADIESKLAYSIDMGYIKTFESLIIELRKLWNKKYQKF